MRNIFLCIFVYTVSLLSLDFSLAQVSVNIDGNKIIARRTALFNFLLLENREKGVVIFYDPSSKQFFSHLFGQSNLGGKDNFLVQVYEFESTSPKLFIANQKKDSTYYYPVEYDNNGTDERNNIRLGVPITDLHDQIIKREADGRTKKWMRFSGNEIFQRDCRLFTKNNEQLLLIPMAWQLNDGSIRPMLFGVHNNQRDLMHFKAKAFNLENNNPVSGYSLMYREQGLIKGYFISEELTTEYIPFMPDEVKAEPLPMGRMIVARGFKVENIAGKNQMTMDTRDIAFAGPFNEYQKSDLIYFTKICKLRTPKGPCFVRAYETYQGQVILRLPLDLPIPNTGVLYLIFAKDENSIIPVPYTMIKLPGTETVLHGWLDAKPGKVDYKEHDGALEFEGFRVEIEGENYLFQLNVDNANNPDDVLRF